EPAQAGSCCVRRSTRPVSTSNFQPPTSNFQSPTPKALPIPNSQPCWAHGGEPAWKLVVGSALEVGSWKLGVGRDADTLATHMAGSYTANDIPVLEGLEPVRKRPGMYIGGVGRDGLHHLAWEILDNAI